jgi:hypothetical protein
VSLVPLGVARSGEGSEEEEATLLSGPRDPLERELEPPLPDAYRGSWFGRHTPPMLTATTAADGSLRIDGLTLGQAYVVLTRGWQTWDKTFGLLAPTPDVRPTESAPRVERELVWEEYGALRVLCRSPAVPQVLVAMRDRDGRYCQTGTWDGCALMEDVPPGPVHLEVWCDGYVADERRVDVKPGVTLEVEVRLEPAARVVGTLLDTNGRPARSAWVGVQEGLRAELADADTGAFTIWPGRPGTYRLVYGAAGEEDREIEVSAPAEGVRLSLPAHATANITAGLRWIPGARPQPAEFDWSLTNDASQRQSIGETAAEEVGLWRRWEVRAGGYVLRVNAADCTLLERRVEVKAGQALDLGTLDVAPMPAVEGEVRFRDGSAAAEAKLHVRGLGHARTDADGRFRFEYGPSGSVTAVVGGVGYPVQVVELPRPRPSRPWRITLETGGVLEGRIEGRGDSAGLAVVITALDGAGRAPSEPPRLDSAGRFAQPLVVGRYRVDVRAGDETLASSNVRIVDGEVTSVALPVPVPAR